MKAFVSIILIFIVSVFGGCSTDEESHPKEYDTIMDLVESPEFQQAEGADVTVALDSLAKLLQAYPELVDILNGPTEHTLFAPSNQAFIDWIDTFSWYGSIADIREDILKGIIFYHVVEGSYLNEEICGWSIDGHETLLTCDIIGARIRVNSNCNIANCQPGKSEVLFTDKDKKALNGNVHIIEAVLLPHHINSCVICDYCSSTLAFIQQDFNYPGNMFQAEYSYFAQVILLADCGVSGVDPILLILSGNGPMTLFLPTNAAFEEAAANQGMTISQLIDSYSPSQWRNIILNHIVIEHAYSLAELIDLFELTTLQHDACRLTVTDVAVTAEAPLGKVLATSGCTTGINEGTGASEVPILTANLNASNGVAHAVGKILFPN